MATPSTVSTWALNGSTTQFDVPFDYLSRTFVKVTLIGTTVRPLVQGTDFQFVTPTRIQTFQAYGPPEFSMIEVRRETSTTERLVEFHDASILTAVDLNTDSLQVLHVAEEARNSATESISVNNDGNLDARGRRIVNVAAPVDHLDAVNRNYVDTVAGGVGTARDEAVAAAALSRTWATMMGGSVVGNDFSSRYYATQAGTSAASSLSYANSAQAGSSSASQSAQAASASAGSALNQANIAEGHKTSAASSALAAKSSENAAELSKNMAYNWSNYMSGPVAGVEYSARYWAQVAQGGAIPYGSVTWEKLDDGLKYSRFLQLAGGAVNGPVIFNEAVTADKQVSAGAGVELGPDQTYGGYSTQVSWMPRGLVGGRMWCGLGPTGLEFRSAQNSPDGVVATVRHNGDITAKGDVYSRGTKLAPMPRSFTSLAMTAGQVFTNGTESFWWVTVLGTTSSTGALLEVRQGPTGGWYVAGLQGAATGANCGALIPPGAQFRTMVNIISAFIITN